MKIHCNSFPITLDRLVSDTLTCDLPSCHSRVLLLIQLLVNAVENCGSFLCDELGFLFLSSLSLNGSFSLIMHLIKKPPRPITRAQPPLLPVQPLSSLSDGAVIFLVQLPHR